VEANLVPACGDLEQGGRILSGVDGLDEEGRP
jgi:hypothetical protein